LVEAESTLWNVSVDSLQSLSLDSVFATKLAAVPNIFTHPGRRPAVRSRVEHGGELFELAGGDG